ncbi:MAG: folate-binding protein, partial [Rhodospirillales bacterium]|nr:folate-binding protein [Rhodospirillales bacterium]
MARSFILLDHRGLLRIDGADRRSFLQGLTSNDVAKVSEGRAVYSAVLTPQGKFLHDFCLTEMGEALWLDPEAARAEDLRKRLTLYKLRSKVSLAVVEDWRVVVLVGEGAAEALDLPAGDAGAARLWGSGV